MENDETITRDLFDRYLEVCNKAIAKHAEKIPFKQIIESEQAQKNVGVCIVDDIAKPSITMKLDGQKCLCASDVLEGACQTEWRVTRSYLEKVINNPEEYINNPAKIDWDWIVEE